MCTVTWWHDASAQTLEVWFNRDERRTRPASELVQPQQSEDGTQFLAPRDPAGGGTWLLANAHGLVAGVLNHYAAAPLSDGTPPARSRGMLPLHMATCRDMEDVAKHWRTLELAAFAPFIFVAWARDVTRCWSWDGSSLQTEGATNPPLTTSSHRTREICAWRRDRYHAIVPALTSAALAGYHDDISHPDSAFNIRMRRADARTESVCAVVVTPHEIRFRHRREAADRLAARDERELVLPRK